MLKVNVPENGTVKLYGGDIEITNVTTHTCKVEPQNKKPESLLDKIGFVVSSLFANEAKAAKPDKSTKTHHRVAFSHIFYCMKLKALTLNSYISYISQSVSVNTITDSGGSYVARFFPVSVSLVHKSAYVLRRRAHLQMRWSVAWPLGSKYITEIPFGLRQLHLIGDHLGQRWVTWYEV